MTDRHVIVTKWHVPAWRGEAICETASCRSAYVIKVSDWSLTEVRAVQAGAYDNWEAA